MQADLTAIRLARVVLEPTGRAVGLGLGRRGSTLGQLIVMWPLAIFSLPCVMCIHFYM